mgnify:CR=1 FL=1|jgi:hypothetical protein
MRRQETLKIGEMNNMEWRVYILTGGKRFCYHATRSKAEALDKLTVLERRHDSRYQFEIEPVTF